MKSRFCLLLASLLAFSFGTSLEAGFTIHRGKIIDSCELPTMSAEKHYEMGARALGSCDWEGAVLHFRIIEVNFSSTVYGQDALFFLGTAYYFLEEYDFANEALTNYLETQTNPRYFQEVIEYKMAIADKFAAGSKRRFFGTKRLPKWACGKDMALEIYDEVIAAVPCHDIAAQALVSKGYLLWCMKDYRSAIESFQLVIRRFPKNELAPECYVLISYVFLDQCKHEFQNPDILAFADINYGRFKKDFPREARICVVEENVQAIKEMYACGLFETGQFYERTCHPRAAVIYYHNAIHQFPDTCVAEKCSERLACLDATYSNPYEVCDEVENPAEELEEREPRSGGAIEKQLEIMGS